MFVVPSKLFDEVIASFKITDHQSMITILQRTILLQEEINKRRDN